MKKIIFISLLSATLISCGNKSKNENAVETPEQDTTQVAAATEEFSPEEGKHYLDITVPMMGGGELKLSEFIPENKLTIVDCWASWCPPCVAEMPNLVAIYKKYHEQGLEILGISFDKEEHAWTNKVSELGMTWPQGSELNGWENQMMEKYGVNSIPCTFIINQKGTILARGLRGEELEEFIKQNL